VPSFLDVTRVTNFPIVKLTRRLNQQAWNSWLMLHKRATVTSITAA